MQTILTNIISFIRLATGLVLIGVPILSIQAQEIASSSELRKKAEFALKHGDFYTALDNYEKALHKNPLDLELKFKLGELQMNTRDYASAYKTFSELMAVEPKEPLLDYYYGIMCKRTGDYETAYRILDNFTKSYRGSDSHIYKRKAKAEAEGARLAIDLLHQSSTYTVRHIGNGINSAYTDFSPIYIGDDKMIFSSLRSDTLLYQNASKSSKKFKHRTRFYNAVKTDGNWVITGEFDGPFNHSKYDVGNGAFSQDGKRFYFTQCSLNEDHVMICNIFLSRLQGENWTKPVPLDEIINYPGATTTQPCIAKDPRSDGDILYFVSDRPQSRGGLDIWYSTFNERYGKWQHPRNLGRRVNTSADEMTPFYDPLFGYLYFSSDGWPGVGGLDIFKVKGSEAKFQSYPVNLGFPVNSGADDMYYFIDNNTNQGFIVSNRPESISLKSPTCCDDIFEFNLDRSLEFNLEGYTYIRQHNDSSQPTFLADATIRIFRAESDIPVGEEASNNNGYYLLQLNPESDYYITAQKEGFLTYRSETISTKGLKKSATIKQPAIVLLPTTKEAMKVDNIYYAYDSYELTETTKIVLDSTIYKIMIANPKVILEIGSHTDNRGTYAYNLKLSTQRAENVVNYLIEKGIEPDRLEAKGYADSQPIATNTNRDGTDNPNGRAKNRRTEIKIIGQIKINPDDLSVYD